MEIEELIYKRLRDCTELAEILTTYQDTPAVFYQTAPDDKKPEWGQKSQYPRVVFDLDKQADSDRKNQGTLAVVVFCEKNGTEPEEIESIVKRHLQNVLVKPDGNFPYCFAWAKTEGFEMGAAAGFQRQVIGLEIRLDVLEYPMQQTTDPDPVMALNCYIEDEYPDICVVGHTHMDSYTEVGTKAPAFYVRFMRAEQESITNTVVWINATLAIHVINPDPEYRLKVMMDLANKIARCGEIIMLDGSPMRPVRLTVDNTTDYLRTGQINVTMYYGLLRWRAQPHKIVQVSTNIEIAKEEQNG